MALANDLQALIDKSRREFDAVSDARLSLAELNSRMEGLYYDLAYHEDCRRALATQLVHAASVPAYLPKSATALDGNSLKRIEAGLDMPAR